MKKTQMLAVLAASLIASSASALDAWKGSKFIYTNAEEAFFALKVDLNPNGNAKVARNFNSGAGVYYQDGDSIKIKLEKSFESQGIELVKNPYTGTEELVTISFSISEIILKGSVDNLAVIDKGTKCYSFNTNEGPMKEDCRDFTSNDSFSMNMIARSNLKPVNVEISNGNRIVIPVEQTNRAFVQIDNNGLATPVDSNIEINKKVQSVQKSNGKINVTLIDGSTITYGQTRMIEGQSRVIGIHKKDNDETLVSGVIVVADQEVDLSSFKPTGTYQAIMAGGISSQTNLEYQFNSDGFGGMKYRNDDNGEVVLSPWSWEYKDNMIHANRYFSKDREQLVDTNEGIKNCVTTENNQCFLFEQRTYKILKRNGNKYTILRNKITQSPNQGYQYEEQSVWVIYKK